MQIESLFYGRKERRKLKGEKKAYNLGISNTLSILDQTLNEMIEDENCSFNNIAVHVPGLEVMTE